MDFSCLFLHSVVKLELRNQMLRVLVCLEVFKCATKKLLYRYVSRNCFDSLCEICCFLSWSHILNILHFSLKKFKEYVGNKDFTH